MLEELQNILDGKGIPFVNALFNFASDIAILYDVLFYLAYGAGGVMCLVGWWIYTKSKDANHSGGGNGVYLIISGLMLTVAHSLIASTTVSILGAESTVTPFDYLKEADAVHTTNPFLSGLFSLLVIVNLAGYAYFLKSLVMIAKLDKQSDKGDYTVRILWTAFGSWILIQIVAAANAAKHSFMY